MCGWRRVSAWRLAASGVGRFAVVFGVGLAGFRGMMRRVMKMAVGDVGMVRGDVMVFFFVVPSSFAVMMRREFMMFSSLLVMLDRLLGHRSSSRVYWGGCTG